MILGIGTDLVDAKRIEHLSNIRGEQFLEKVFSKEERQQGESRTDERRRMLFWATRFAAKEACSKALGTGIREGIRFKDIVVTNDALGKPHLTLHGKALERLETLVGERAKECIPRIDLSLSDEYPMCSAFVIISAE